MKREKVLKIRVSETELQRLKENAEVGGLSTSGYLRSVGLHRHIKPLCPANVQQSVSRFGQNLNQLAHAGNIGRVDPEAVSSLTSTARELVKLIAKTCRN